MIWTAAFCIVQDHYCKYLITDAPIIGRNRFVYFGIFYPVAMMYSKLIHLEEINFGPGIAGLLSVLILADLFYSPDFGLIETLCEKLKNFSEHNAKSSSENSLPLPKKRKDLTQL